MAHQLNPFVSLNNNTQVMRDLHDSPLSGHLGPDKTLSLVRHLVFWPGMTQTVSDYVASCPIGQRVKADHTVLSRPASFHSSVAVRGGRQRRNNQTG